eukprot:7234852-Pyramimonas_sp.AAC.1
MRSAQSESDNEYGPGPRGSDTESEISAVSDSSHPDDEGEESRCAILEHMSAFSGAGDLSAFAGRGLHGLVWLSCRCAVPGLNHKHPCSCPCLLIVRNLCVRVVIVCTLVPAP